MVVLSFSRSSSNADQEEAVLARDVEELNQANLDDTTTELHFNDYCFDEDSIVAAAIDLMRRAFQKGRLLDCLTIDDCTGRGVDDILHVAFSVDIFDKIAIFGDSVDVYSELSLYAFFSIRRAIKFNKRLTKLELKNLYITRQQAVALGEGLITSSSPHFKELRMYGVAFDDGAIGELAAGLKHNSSLCTLTADSCHLEDVELAELVGAVEAHPSLKELWLRENSGQEHALVALGKVLASTICRLEVLNFSMVNFSIHTSRDGLAGRLEMLVQAFLQGSKSLTHLDLSSNRLVDKDMADLGQILATCKLETLNLNGNEITHSGFVSLTQDIPGSLQSFDFSRNYFYKEEAACHTLTLFEEHPQLWEDGFNWEESMFPKQWEDGFNWEESMFPKHQEIQHFKDLNRCGRILLPRGVIPLSVWPIVLARATTLLSDSKERATNAIFHLLQGPALMERRFDLE